MRQWSGEDAAHTGVGAVGRVQGVAADDEVFQLRFESSKFGLARADSGKLAAKQGDHVVTRHIAAVSHFDHAADLGEGETCGLRAPDEQRAGHARIVVVAVAVRGPLRLGQQAFAFVEPDGLTRHADGVGKFPYQHRHRLPLDLAVRYKVYGRHMEITLQYFDGCPNWRIADERLAVLAAARPDLRISHQKVETVEEAERVGFHGSPTVLVDGTDPFAHAEESVGLACRIYQTPQGPAGAPTLEQLRQAVDHA